MSSPDPGLNLDLGLMATMIVLDLDPLMFEAMVEVIERTAMMMADMRELKSEGTVKIDVSGSTIRWYN